MMASAELLGQCDEDALGAADVTEPIAVLVLHHLADEFGAIGLQPGKDVLDVLYGEHDATDTQRIHRCVRFSGGSRRRVEPGQLESAVAVRGPHHRDVASDTVEPDNASTDGPSTVVSPSSSRPSSTKNAITASRSLTTMPTLSIRGSVI